MCCLDCALAVDSKATEVESTGTAGAFNEVAQADGLTSGEELGAVAEASWTLRAVGERETGGSMGSAEAPQSSEVRWIDRCFSRATSMRRKVLAR